MRRVRRGIGAFALLLLGVAATTLSLRTSSAGPAPPDIAALVASVQQQNVEDHIDQLSDIIGPRSPYGEPSALQAAADYVEDELQGYGYSVTVDPVTHAGLTFPNVIGVQDGTVCPERVFIVGAHYDTVPNAPGADDDASGIAGVLEIARVLSGTPLPATVWYTGFTMEELGLLGSIHMAQEESGQGTPIIGMYSFDMIAYTEEPPEDSIAVIGNEASVRLMDSFERASETYVPELATLPVTVPGNGQTIPDTRRSDHAPFWDAGYQALFATDMANFRNPYYHTPLDTIDTLDLLFATNVTKAMLATTADYLTYDGDSDTQPDACTGPLAATATPTPTMTTTPTATGTPTATPIPPPVGGIAALPEVGRAGLETPYSAGGGHPAVPLLVGVGAAGGVLLGAAGWLVRRQQRRHG